MWSYLIAKILREKKFNRRLRDKQLHVDAHSELWILLHENASKHDGKCEAQVAEWLRCRLKDFLIREGSGGLTNVDRKGQLKLVDWVDEDGEVLAEADEKAASLPADKGLAMERSFEIEAEVIKWPDYECLLETVTAKGVGAKATALGCKRSELPVKTREAIERVTEKVRQKMGRHG